MSDPQSYRPKNIPTDPGVYRFYDERDQVIYVGKALNLRNRLSSYFQSNLADKTYRMVHTAVRVDWTIVGSEVEALSLEYTWIKQFNPRFNIKFRDDKSYPYLAISLNEEFPRIYVSRQKPVSGVKYKGPFAHAWALRSSMDSLLRIYPVRSCTSGNFARAVATKRQCLLGDIGKCSAPCVGWISKDDHRAMAARVGKFFEDSSSSVVSLLEEEMGIAAAKQDYERAGSLRDQIQALAKAGESALVALDQDMNCDLVATYKEITHMAASIFVIRAGRIQSSRSWIIELSDELSEAELLPQILGEIYSNQELPKELLVDLALNINETDIAAGGGNSVEAWLAAIAGHTVNIKVPQRGEKFELMQTVRRNAQEALVQFLSKRSADASVSGAALEQLQIELGLPALPLRIECFDISNTQGTNSVASMVVFEDGRPAKSGYRRFAIKGEQLLDDTRAMNQVLSRRLQRLIDEEQIDQLEIKVAGAATPKFSYRPQLIVVDGGAPQVAAAAAVLAQMEISDISLIGLAKRLEEVWLPGESDPIILPRHSEALYLLQRLRDEAHRFAITFHRSKRAKAMLESLFDEIPGLGEARRKALLGAFGSVAAIKKVDVGEIAAVPGIGEKLAQLIYDRLQDAVQVDLLTGEILE